MTYVRGNNPVWSMVDLTGHQLDDTYYLFVLENEIPYIPSTVYASSTGIALPNPLQFLANGTLPVDMYFDPELVYRLEIRQGNTQADPLIYLVENYIPGSNGTNPLNAVGLFTDNQITNPQFSQINFTSTYTLTGATDPTIDVAPGWTLVLNGTGNVTLTQVPLFAPNLKSPTNAPYALRITLSGGWTGSQYLKQRFNQNGMLWANKYVSGSITAKTDATTKSISSRLIDSLGTPLQTILRTTAIDSVQFNEYQDYGLLPATTNTDVPPNAWVEYQVVLPNDIDIYITSMQLIVSDIPTNFGYEQSTIERQIDQLYHVAYPIVPIGTIIDYMGFTTPTHYLDCDGTAISRTTYSRLFDVLTTTEDVVLTATTNTFSVASSANYWIGMAVEGDGIPAPTTISNIAGVVITISNNATLSGTHTVRFFAVGVGDGSTTFNLPDLKDYVIAGVGGSLFGSGNNGIGKKSGSSTHTLTANELAAHNHGPAATNTGFVGTGGGGSGPFAGSAGFAFSGFSNTADNVTTNDAFSIVQQTALTKKCIRFE